MTRRIVPALFITLQLALPAAAASVTDELFSRQWGLAKVGAPAAWDTSAGSGTTIAVVDTGVDLRHPDLKGNLVSGYDFVANDEVPQDETSDTSDPQDSRCTGNPGHGTHVAGIAAALANNDGIGIAGVAPQARIMPVRVLGKYGCGNIDNVAEGIRWAADHNAHVINLSLGESPIFRNVLGSLMEDAIEHAWRKGAVVVVAAGNDAIFPSGYRLVNAIVVAATDRNDQKAGFSNLPADAKWGMAAPGSEVISTIPVNNYAEFSGTSMAAPHVAGAAAALRCLGLGNQQTVDRILSTADKVGPEFGHGRLNVGRAVAGLDGTRCALAARAEEATKGPVTAGKAGAKPGARPQGSPTSDQVQAPPSPGQGEAAPSPESTGTATGGLDKRKGGFNPNVIVVGIGGLAVAGYWAARRLFPKLFR